MRREARALLAETRPPDRRRASRAALVGVSLALLFAASGLGSQPGSAAGFLVADVSFATPVRDHVFADVLRSAGARPKAVLMRAGPLVGTYRTFREPSALEFTRSARARAIGQFEWSLRRNVGRMREFASDNTLRQVASSERLTKQALSLLRIRLELQNARALAARGEELIFAAEVAGEPSGLEALSQHPRVDGVRLASERTVRPLPFETRQRLAADDRPLVALSAQEAYRQIQSLIK